MKSKFMLFCFALMTSFVNAQSCPSAQNLSHSFVNGINYFTWTGDPGVTDYSIEIMESGAYAPWELLTTTSSTSFTTPGGLLSATYDWRIVSNCPLTPTTTGIATFTLPCPAPTALITTNITQTSATICWDNPYGQFPYEQGVGVAYRPLGSSTWIQLTTSTLNQNWPLSGLTPGTTYEWCVNLNCPYFDSDPVVAQFTTNGIPCGVPQTLNVLNLSANSALLNWAGVSGANSYTIQYRVAGGNWNTINTASSFTQYNLTNLAFATNYEYKVAANCASGQSAYSNVYAFSTNCVSLNNSSEYLDFFKINTILRVSGQEANGYANLNTNTNLVKGTTYQTQLSAGFTASSYAESFAIYLDVNKNGSFELSERIHGVGMLSNGNTKTFNMTIPSATVSGPNTLRVILLRQGQPGVNMVPCPVPGSFGEVEDYAVTIVSPPSSSELTDTNAETAEEVSASIRAASMLDDKVTIYPNPSNGLFTITCANGIVSYQIYNTSGTMIKESTNAVPFDHIDIDLQNNVQGLYYVKATTTYGDTHYEKLYIQF
jgi:GEVED domain/Secretion system C-terminal sorting domain/Fibronectin type III domain